MSRHDARHYPLLWFIALVIAGVIAFAAIFDIDQSVRAHGQVIPGARTQVIQAVDGGVLTAIHVREGDRVRAGEVLAELEPDRAQAGLAQAEAEVLSKRVALVRAQAELADQAPAFGGFDPAAREFVAAQQGLFEQRRRGRDEELGALNASLGLARQELAMSRKLYGAGDLSRTEVMRAERQVLDLEARASTVRNKYYQDARVEVTKLEEELAGSRARRDERRTVLRHTTMLAPMDGVVKSLRINTVGGVLRPSDELMQISPVDDPLVVEIKVNPADRGLLHPGLPVTLRFDAFDSNIYGTVPGVLRYISPDTLSEQGAQGKAQVYYRAEVNASWDAMAHQAARRLHPADIKPGMIVTADVRVGTRSLLYYLAKPITRAFSGALRER
ncbi:MAG: HlyD family efflux transporter periplasmic adaptor subunit [Bordetella sp.]|nr:HlyD family efflux transporter periplasmic adaptor subunit [Bordetella sp.]